MGKVKTQLFYLTPPKFCRHSIGLSPSKKLSLSSTKINSVHLKLTFYTFSFLVKISFYNPIFDSVLTTPINSSCRLIFLSTGPSTSTTSIRTINLRANLT